LVVLGFSRLLWLHFVPRQDVRTPFAGLEQEFAFSWAWMSPQGALVLTVTFGEGSRVGMESEIDTAPEICRRAGRRPRDCGQNLIRWRARDVFRN
jgi:hypothetical protein